mgnify:FL=1
MSKPAPSTKSYRYFREGRIWSKRKKKDVPIDESRFGEPCVHFFVDRRIQMRLLDELIWEHFNHMEIPYQHELRHIDCDGWNCSLDNLELVDLREEFTPIERWPVFGVSRNAEVINFTTNHRIATRFREDRGQMVVSFRAEGQTRTMLLNTVVWEAFNGEIPSDHYIGYKDEDKENCSLDNLELRKKAERAKKPRRSRWDPDENGFMPIDYYINMKDGVKGAVESGIPQHCRVVL